MAITIGIIAEDDSDIEVAKILIGKIGTKRFKIKKFVGRGCGKMLAKCHNWACDLRARGCTLLAIIHDLDERKEPILRNALLDALAPTPIARFVIVIPVKTIEAWLLADHGAINRALKPKRPITKIATPQSVSTPKRRLGALIYSHSDKRITYINTLHNPRIAEHFSVPILKSRCQSFAPFAQFFHQHLT